MAPSSRGARFVIGLQAEVTGHGRATSLAHHTAAVMRHVSQGKIGAGKRLAGDAGVALLEVLIAGVVLGVAIIGIALMFSLGQTFVLAQGDDRAALYLAVQKIESLRRLGYNSVIALNLDPNCSGTTPADETLTAGVNSAHTFTRQTRVELVQDADLTTLTCTENSMRLTVTVTPTTMRQADTVTLVTVLTKY